MMQRSSHLTDLGKDLLYPVEPSGIESTGIPRLELEDLVLRTIFSVREFTLEWLAKKVCLSLRIVSELIEKLQSEEAVEILGQAGTLTFRMRVTDLGRKRASEALRGSGYIGPAPVPVDDYAEMLEKQMGVLPEVSPAQVEEAIKDLVLDSHAKEVAGLARSSGRSLFLWGPPGNGKTTLGHLLHNAIEGEVWIPFCLASGGSIIKLFDPQCHEISEPEELSADAPRYDRRWVRIRRPFVVVGGELALDDLDLAFHPALRYYEAPMHLKANGGTFLIDDFGCQRADPLQILHRWVLPLESNIDYLTLKTGQKVPVPFRQMLILSTNLDPEKVMDAAFLRRMGYRLFLGYLTEGQYEQTFRRYASGKGIDLPSGLVEGLIQRYKLEGRPLRGSEPRDLIERSLDICKYRNEYSHVDEEILHTAWKGYFGTR